MYFALRDVIRQGLLRTHKRRHRLHHTIFNDDTQRVER